LVGPTSSWPFSSFVMVTSPRAAASCTKRENFDIPRFFSSNVASMSCITCFKRSERITSPFFAIRPTASTTSSHGSHFTVSSSEDFTSPANAL
jgi:hypothetical protein